MAVKERLEDDLFQDTVMTFGEHLEELRICLWRALIGLVVAALLGLLVADYVVLWIQTPLTNALKQFYRKQARTRIEEMAEAGLSFPYTLEDVGGLIDEERMTFEQVYVDARGLTEQLKEQYPEQFAGVNVPPNAAGHSLTSLGPLHVLPADVRDPRAMAQRLVGAAEARSPPPLRVWSLLGAEQQQRLRKLAEEGPADDAARQRAATDVALMLEELLDQELDDGQSFAALPLSAEGQELRGRAVRTELEERRLRRLLLEATLGGALAPSHRQMVQLVIWRPVDENIRVRPTALSAQEAFGIWIKAALVVGAIIASPWIFYQLWIFVAAGLYRHEKRYVYIYLPFSIGLFLGGAALAAGFVFEPVLNFLFNFNADLGIDPDPRISEWMSFVLILPIGFGISFQLPLVMLFLERIGIFTVSSYTANWRLSVLVIFVVAMVLTPADPYSMLLMAVPLVGLFVLGIGLCKWMPRGRLFAPVD